MYEQTVHKPRNLSRIRATAMTAALCVCLGHQRKRSAAQVPQREALMSPRIYLMYIKLKRQKSGRLAEHRSRSRRQIAHTLSVETPGTGSALLACVEKFAANSRLLLTMQEVGRSRSAESSNSAIHTRQLLEPQSLEPNQHLEPKSKGYAD